MMAFLKPFNKFGTVFKDTYWRIKSINIDRSGKSCLIHVDIYFNKKARDNEEQVLATVVLAAVSDVFDIYYSNDILSAEGNNVIKSSYNYIKTSDGYTDVVDV